jgi:PPOX class probable F420-dependent enzyme
MVVVKEEVAMTIEEAQEFCRHNHRAVLATFRRDGRVQQSPVAVVADDDGTLMVSSRETAMKTRNLRRDPRAAVCVFTENFFGSWVSAEGQVTVESLPGAMEALVRYYRLAVGEHPDWEDYRAAMNREQRVVLRLRIERAGPSVSG